MENKQGNINNIPVGIGKNQQWVSTQLTWNNSKNKYDKKPLNSRTGKPAKWSNPEEWSSFDDVERLALARPDTAPGYIMTEGEKLVCIDLDDCYDGDTLKPYAQHLVGILQSYTERSVSMNGIHILCGGATELKGDVTIIHEGQEYPIEVFTKGRIITMTGDLIDPELSEIVDGQKALDQLAGMVKKPVAKAMTVKGGSFQPFAPDQEIKKLESALQHIDPDEYATWLEIGMAVKLWGCGNGCEDLAWLAFDAWSAGTKAENYDQQQNQNSWESWDGTNTNGQQVTLGTVYHKAKSNGWTFDNRQLTSGQNGQSGGRPPIPFYSDTAQRFYTDVLLDSESGYPTMLQQDGAWHQYSSEGWAVIPKERIKSRISTFMQDQPDLRGHCSSNYFRSVLDNLGSGNHCGTEQRMPIWLDSSDSADHWMGFSDGKCVNMLEMARAEAGLAEKDESRYVRPLSPAFFSQSFVDYPIQVTDPKMPLFQAYLDRIQPDPENQRMLQQLAGLALTDETRYESCFAMVGSGANGKTVFLDILSALIGRQNVSSVDLQMLDQRFQTFPLATSKLNICGEMPTDIGVSSLHKVEGILKHCVSGGEIEIERKGLDKTMAKCRARFVFASNSMPTFVDKSNGIWRRLRVIDFPITVPVEEQDVNLADKIIKDELSGILHWAIAGLVDIIRNGTVFESEHSKKLKEGHKLDSDKERLFLGECCEFRSEIFESKEVLFQNYAEWCRRNGYRYPMSKNKFLARVQEIYPDLQTNQRGYDETKKRVRCFDGLALTEDLLEEDRYRSRGVFGRNAA